MMSFDPRKDVIVRIRPAARQLSATHNRTESGNRLYDVFVYSSLPLVTPMPSRVASPPPMFHDIPLAGIEHLTIHPTSFEDYLASFIEGEKGLPTMRDRMLETMSPGLRKMLTEPSSDLRIWWSSAAPELDDFPWELTAGPRVVLLRGAPPETPIPVLPVAQNPRLAILGASNRRPSWAGQLREEFPQVVTSIDLPLRMALGSVAQSGFELVHVFSDGIVSNALEGILYDADTDTGRPELPSGELSSILAGTRVAVLALSRAEDSGPDKFILAGRSVLSAFRAFAYLGASTLPLPTIIAPLGPIPEQMISEFWLRYYRALIDSWHLTRSLQQAQQSFSITLPVALFCRHAAGRLFQRSEGVAVPDAQRVEVRQDFLQSQQLHTALTQLGEKYGKNLPGLVREFIGKVEGRQARLREELETWKPIGEDL
jgi:hypothetical protein